MRAGSRAAHGTTKCGSVSLVLFHFLLFRTHRTLSLRLSCLFADTTSLLRKVIIKVSTLLLSICPPPMLHSNALSATHCCLRARMVCLEKPWLSATSVTGKWENGSKNPENTSVVCAYLIKTFSLCYTHSPWSLLHTAGTTWRKMKWDQIQEEWGEDNPYYLIFIYSFPTSFLFSLLIHAWIGLLVWNQGGSSSALWSFCFLGQEMKAAREPGIREQCSQPNSYHVPATHQPVSAPSL